MKNRWKQLAVVAFVVALGASGGIARAHQAEGPDRDAPVPHAKALGGGITETKFVPITPCRAVDTRKGTPAPAVGQERSVAVRGASSPAFAAQGGNAAGCGIPLYATAVEVTISAVDPSADGYLRAYPTAPAGATFLNYQRFEDTGNSGTVALCTQFCQAGKDFRYKVAGGATDVVVDVQGYHTPPIAGMVAANGTSDAEHASRLSSVRKALGSYELTFDRDISECAVVATPRTASRALSTQPVNATKVKVVATDLGGTAIDTAFDVAVTC